MLQRIYGTAWFKKEDLAAYLHRLEEARKRDHRRLGKELDLFVFHPSSPGAAFWTDRGTTIYREVNDYIRELQQRADYQEIKTPLLYNKTSGSGPGTGASTARTCSWCSTASRASTTSRSSR